MLGHSFLGGRWVVGGNSSYNFSMGVDGIFPQLDAVHPAEQMDAVGDYGDQHGEDPVLRSCTNRLKAC